MAKVIFEITSVDVSPAASTIAVNASANSKRLPGDRSRRRVTDNLQFRSEIIEGGGHPRDKELVLRNFSGVPGDQLLERMIELSLYTEDKL
jgi:hypothetical protein